MPYPYPLEDDDFDIEADQPLPRRSRKSHKPRSIKYEMHVPDNYKAFQQLGIPTDLEERWQQFLRNNNVPSPEVIAHYEAKANEIASWLNPQLYKIERRCLQAGTLAKAFQSLEKSEILANQLESTTAVVDVLQAKLDDQLFPWVTKSNLKKYGPLVLTFALIVIATFIWFKSSNGNSTQVPGNPASSIQSSQSSTAPTQVKPGTN